MRLGRSLYFDHLQRLQIAVQFVFVNDELVQLLRSYVLAFYLHRVAVYVVTCKHWN